MGQVVGSISALFVAGFLAVAPGSETASPWVQYPVLGATAALSLFAVWRVYRSIIAPLSNRVEDQQRELERERRRREVAEWRFDRLVLWLRDSEGIAVPDDIRFGRPGWLAPEEVGD